MSWICRVFSLCFLGLCSPVGQAVAYEVESGSLGNELRIQIDDRSGASPTTILEAEIVSLPGWIAVSGTEIIMGRVREVVTVFDVTEVSLGERGILTLRLFATTPSGETAFEQFRSVPLSIAARSEPTQRSFAIDECCLSVASVEDWTVLPSAPTLLGVTPNPVRSLANVVFELPEGGGRVELRIYDVQGRMLREIETPTLDGGYHKIAWDGTDSVGLEVAPGVYFYRLSVGSWSETRKMQILK